MTESPLYLFVDFDDTLCDHELLQRIYLDELAALLSSDFGATPDVWRAALVPEIAETRARYAERFRGAPLAGYTAWLPEERARLGAAVFQRAGVEPPVGEPMDQLVQRLQFDALSCCDAAIPGSRDALRELFEAGVRTQLASSNDSEYLFAAMMGAHLESYTESKFGPDLVDCAKEGPEFYQRIFAACNVHPSRAVVLDDRTECLDWAEEAGARVIQACVVAHAPEPEFPYVLRSYDNLMALLREMGRLA